MFFQESDPLLDAVLCDRTVLHDVIAVHRPFCLMQGDSDTGSAQRLRVSDPFFMQTVKLCAFHIGRRKIVQRRASNNDAYSGCSAGKEGR